MQTPTFRPAPVGGQTPSQGRPDPAGRQAPLTVEQYFALLKPHARLLIRTPPRGLLGALFDVIDPAAEAAVCTMVVDVSGSMVDHLVPCTRALAVLAQSVAGTGQVQLIEHDSTVLRVRRLPLDQVALGRTDFLRGAGTAFGPAMDLLVRQRVGSALWLTDGVGPAIPPGPAPAIMWAMVRPDGPAWCSPSLAEDVQAGRWPHVTWLDA